jgi:hypothetical protein
LKRKTDGPSPSLFSCVALFILISWRSGRVLLRPSGLEDKIRLRRVAMPEPLFRYFSSSRATDSCSYS